MMVNERAANETRVTARWLLSSMLSDSNVVADLPANAVRIGRNTQDSIRIRAAIKRKRARLGDNE